MKIEMRKTSEIKPYEKNPRLNDEAVDAVAASIQEFGFRQPIVVDEAGVIVVGDTRWKAAKKLGLAKVPVHVARGLTPAQIKGYRIADNATGARSEWNLDLLGIELGELQNENFDLGLLGFDPKELENLVGGKEGLTDPDAVPEPPKKAITKRGDLWILGEHRLLCGDSTKAEDVARVMRGEKAMLCFTSPPYAQQRDYGKVVDDWDGLMRGVFGNLPMADDGQLLVNLGLVHRDGEWWSYWDGWITWMRGQAWRRFGWYVWDQGFGLPGDWNGRLSPSHEFLFHFNRIRLRPQKWLNKKPENVKPRNRGESTMRDRTGATKPFTNPDASAQLTKIPDSVIRISRQVGSDGHPAQFPVGLPAFILRTWTGLVYEPFAGSGTTIIAAEQLGRRCFGIEIEPLYVDVSVRRWEEFTGKKAKRDAT